MSLSWQDVACGLPVPETPVLPEGWSTRFFSTALVLPAGEAQRLCGVARRLLADGPVIALPHAAGAPWPCRLVAPPEVTDARDGQCRARLEFEVVPWPPGGPVR